MKRTVLLAAISVLFLAGMTFAQPPGQMGHPGPMGMGMSPRWSGEGHPNMGLNLTDEQQLKVDKLRLEHQKEMLELRQEMMALRLKMKNALTADNYKQSDVDDIAAKMGKLQEKIIKARTALERKVRDLLTPEQKILFDSRVLKSDGPGWERRGCGPCPGPMGGHMNRPGRGRRAW